ncbi:MAG: lysophospholipase [Anaerolineales bacterium]|nr:lysophospholipase [Anaerolineales bacterium]MCZ2287627.1 alpha/beta hydrolase [Anaerolineales bacterium]
MKTFEWEWTSFDGLKMYSKGWAPEQDPKAVVCLVHGLGEHIGRYEHVGAAFAEAGYAMLGFDLRGHGKSGGPRGHTPSAEAYYKDIDSFLAETAKRYPFAPRFIYGHSLGGFLSLAYSLSRKPDLRGMIVSSPGLRTALHEQKVKVTLAKVLGAIAPTITLPSGLNAEHISRDPQVVKAYVNDPLVHDKTSTGFGRAALQAGEFVFAHAAELSTPILLAYCSEDKLAFPRGSEEFASLAPKGLVTLKRFDGLYHEPHNEPEKAEVLKTYVQWLDGRMNS